MLKAALTYLNDLSVKAEGPKAACIADHIYGPGGLVRYDIDPKAEPIRATTLSALVEYMVSCGEELRDRTIVHIKSPKRVEVYSGLLDERDRETLFIAEALLPVFDYGKEYGQEAFLVRMQSCFLPTPDRDAVTALAANIVSSQQAEYSDDGITQQAVIKTGVATKDRAIVPNPVALRPYRTFPEVDQPESEFVFRIGAIGNGEPTFKLVEADGGRWRNAAMANVHDFLNTELYGKIPPEMVESVTILF